MAISGKSFMTIFGRKTASIIGMIHLQPLPGSPTNTLPVAKIGERALKEAEVYMEAGVDAIMIENMHDLPYLSGGNLGPEVVASMATIATRLRQNFTHVPLGIQILTAANKEALAVAKCAGLNFIRAEGFVFAHIGDEGWTDACAGPLLRYRRSIDASDILVFTDIKKKHSSHAVTNDLTLSEVARAAEFFMSDGVVVTGKETGAPTDSQNVTDVQAAVNIPVLVGSGVTVDNVHEYKHASGLIIGSHFKKDGQWKNEVDPLRVNKFMDKIKVLRDESE